MSVTVTLIGKPGCHLCDDAKTVVDSITKDLDEVTVEEVSLEDNPLWSDLYGELIPVVLVDGVEVGHWRVEPDTLAQAIGKRLTADID